MQRGAGFDASTQTGIDQGQGEGGRGLVRTGGRGLLENWTSAAGGAGKSLNAYNPAKKLWQQFWVGADGTVLELTGGLDAKGAMVMTSENSPANPRLSRITWTPNTDGSVRQLWEVSRDAGKTWQTAFDGLYRRKP